MTTELKAPAPWSPPAPLPERCETPRLALRYWQPADAQGMLDAIDADRASMLPWLPWVLTDNRDVAECAATVERLRCNRERHDPPVEDVTLGIFERDRGTPVGGTGLHRFDHRAHEAEIGYWIRADRRGEGLCTEAVAGLISWAFTPQAAGGWGFRRIKIRCAAANLASQRIPRKLGLRQEARLVGERWVEGHGWDDTLAWGVLANEWNVAAAQMAS